MPLEMYSHFLISHYGWVLELLSHKCNVHVVYTIVAVIDFMLEMQKVKDLRILDLWWAVGNTLKADFSRLTKACLSVNARKWSWFEQTAALWSRLSPALDTSHIVPRPPAPPLFNPQTATAWPQKSDPEAPGCSPRHLPTFHPFTGWASGRWGGADKEARVGCCEAWTR